MRRAIFRHCVLVAMAALLLSAAVSSLILYAMRTQEIKTSMELLLSSVKSQIEYDLEHDRFSPQDEVLKYTDYRLSIIGTDGVVLADSSVPAQQMENHKDRPELIAAKKDGIGWATRNSETLGANYTYMAMRVNDGLYVRLSMESAALHNVFNGLFPSVLVGLVFAGIITPVIASRMTRRITEPLIRARDFIEQIAEGDGSTMLPSPEYEELTPIVDSVNTLALRVADALGRLRDERERTKALLDNMEEGLAVIDSRLRVSAVNRACERYMGAAGTQGRNIVYLTRNKRLLSAVENAVHKGRSTLLDVPSCEDGRILSARITPAKDAGAARDNSPAGGGAVLLLTDVTDLRAGERMRSEFVANASHELKTPITSIKGFAELLASGLVKDQAAQEDYLSRITGEATRMTALINDIIRLSEAESGANPEPAEEIDLAALARELAQRLAPAAQEKGVSIAVTGERVMLRARREDARQIIGNLMDNAVKYNRKDGSVTVSCRAENGRVSVSVADTGIGVAREHHARVFERFYCVDKSRSRTVGGTGLGLAIVKHAVAALGGEILFESAEGVGTTVTVLFDAHTA